MSGAALAAFVGSNEEKEIEDVEEFMCLVDGTPAEEVHLDGWVFQGVDLSSTSKEAWDAYDVKGAVLLGCVFPKGVEESDLTTRGAKVTRNPEHLPFKPFRGFMYTQKELQEKDSDIFEHYRSKTDILTTMYQAAHDSMIRDALYDYIEGKALIAIMGGHGMSRKDPMYRKVVLLCRRFANAGILVVTGGGPGAMEAANLGAYLMQHTDEEVDEALALLAAPNSKEYEKEYLNKEAPGRVIERFGWPTHMPSLGIPTYKYGHEPSNMFATWHAKFFSNAIREDGLIQIANVGIVYTPGSAGTRQEVFQDACRNHYADCAEAACPMVFFGEKFWKESGVYDLIYNSSEGHPYHDRLLLSDSSDAVYEHLLQWKEQKKLPSFTLEELQSRHWSSCKK